MCESAFNGKWKLISSDNLMEYSKSIGMKEEFIQMGEKMNDPSNDIIDELKVTDTDVTYSVHVKDQVIKTGTIKWDMEVDEPFFDGRPGKMVATIEGNKHVRVHKGDGFTATYTRSVEGDIMTLELTSDCGPVKAIRKLKKM